MERASFCGLSGQHPVLCIYKWIDAKSAFPGSLYIWCMLQCLAMLSMSEYLYFVSGPSHVDTWLYFMLHTKWTLLYFVLSGVVDI